MIIISGGQTGADRAALDAALAAGVPYAGWCPRGGLAEDFPEPPGLLARYPDLTETPTDRFAERTRWNVRDSDATLVLTLGDALARSHGTRMALDEAAALGRPTLIVDLAAGDAASQIRDCLAQHGRVNVAGPRESNAPGIYRAALDALRLALRRATEHDYHDLHDT